MALGLGPRQCIADFEPASRAERESTVASTSVATVPKARRTIPVPRRSRSAPKSPPAAPKSSSVPEPKGPPPVSRLHKIPAPPAAGVPVPRSSGASRTPRATSTAVSVPPSASGTRVPPKTRSRSPVERRSGSAKKAAAKRPP